MIEIARNELLGLPVSNLDYNEVTKDSLHNGIYKYFDNLHREGKINMPAETNKLEQELKEKQGKWIDFYSIGITRGGQQKDDSKSEVYGSPWNKSESTGWDQQDSTGWGESNPFFKGADWSMFGGNQSDYDNYIKYKNKYMNLKSKLFKNLEN